MFWTILIVVAAIFVGVWVAYGIFNRHVLKLCSAIPVAQPYYPLLGNILLFACPIDRLTSNLFEAIQQEVLKGHRAVCYWFGAYPLIMIVNPGDIKKVLMNSVGRGKEVEESSSEYLKYGLFTAPVDHWKVSRRHLNLSFHTRNLEQLMCTFNSTSNQLVKDLSRLVDGPEVNLMPLVMSAALRTICVFLYGPKILELVSTEQFKNLSHAMELVAELMAIRNIKPWLKNGVLFRLLYSKEINMIKTALNEIFQVANTKSNDEAVADKGTHGFQTIMQAMRQLQEKVPSVTDEHVIDEMTSFFAGGTDTIGVTVSSCLLALAKFPYLQDKVYEEICSVVSEDKEEEVTCVNLKQLTYLEQVIKETLRFFYVVPITARAPNRDLDLGGYTIPANKLTALCIAAVYYDPKYFPDPHNFDPDRFSTPNSLEDVFMPFSRGPRNCIGKEYSMMLMKLMVVHVMRKYKLSTNMDLQNWRKSFKVVLTCCDGYNVFLEKRCE